MQLFAGLHVPLQNSFFEPALIKIRVFSKMIHNRHVVTYNFCVFLIFKEHR